MGVREEMSRIRTTIGSDKCTITLEELAVPSMLATVGAVSETDEEKSCDEWC